MHFSSLNFLLLLLFIQAFLANCCIEHERDALLQFKDGVNDTNSRLASWTGEQCCNWAGIRCNNQTGHVIKLNLRNTNPHNMDNINGDYYDWIYHSLVGKISPSLIFLSDLKYLDLSFNNFNGSKFPDFIGEFRNLKYLNLSYTGLLGTIPPQLGNLSRLMYLDLSNGYPFSSFMLNTDTWWLPNLRYLKHMEMSGVDFKDSNDWVETLNKLSSLEVLVLYENNLTHIPQSMPFVNFTSLRVLHLSYQNFNTTIPIWVGSLHILNVLILEDCNLVGPYPTTLGNLTSLNKLTLDYNSLHGMVPPLHSLTKLTDLSLSGNNIEGDIRELLLGKLSNYTLGNLEYLDLSSTNLSGTLTGWITDMTSVTHLKLHNNNLSGTVPIDIGNLTNLVYLGLGSNSLTGLLSETHLTSLLKLKVLYLEYNNITILVDSDWTPSFQLNSIDLSSCKLGPKFPSWLQRQVEINDLYLTDTGIDDSIPDWFWSLSSLSTLYLSENLLRGKLPASLVHMTKLVSMDLSNNRLEGKIPFLPTSMWYLDLSNNSLSGQLCKNRKSPNKNKPIVSNNNTVEIVELFPCGLTSLYFLDLSSNSLSGHLPPCWSNISYVVNLANNRLSGVVPSSLSCSVRLEVLQLASNNLTGEFPFDLQFCSGLQLLDLGENNFHGIIPDWVGESFQQLKILRLKSNLFSGNIPSKLTQLNNLLFLDLSNNYLSGLLPRGLGNFTSMSQLFLSGTDYYGGVNARGVNAITKGLILEYDYRGLSIFKSMDLSNNNLTGEIPQEIVVLDGLFHLNLSHNHLIGNIPHEIGNITSLESLDFHKNNLSGTIPQSISTLYSLEVLDFSDNNLSGHLPPCWSNISGVVNLENNRLSGVVPISLSCSVTLRVLHLANNNLTGEFPFDLQFCSGLLLLDLGENNFHGIIPDWVGESFQQLKILRLQSNLFSGNIPSKLTQLNDIRLLDISNNNLSGQLPRGLDNFTSMSQLFSLRNGVNDYYYYYMRVIAINKGLILEYDYRELSFLKSMDLSNNNLTGEVPQEIVFLAGLVNLNLSHNHLIGNIPLQIGNMTSLESLDFHKNNLSGTIPQTISTLYSLEVLDFSYNNLSGSIPNGHQLQTLDPSIYNGNPYLCGPPLETSCDRSVRLPSSDDNNDSNSKVTDDRDKWLYLFIEFGFVIGFLVVFFILLFKIKIKWRYTYFQMVDSMLERVYVMGVII